MWKVCSWSILCSQMRLFLWDCAQRLTTKKADNQCWISRTINDMKLALLNLLLNAPLLVKLVVKLVVFPLHNWNTVLFHLFKES